MGDTVIIMCSWRCCVCPHKILCTDASTSIVQSCSDRKLMVWSLLIHQVSTSVLLDNLGSWSQVCVYGDGVLCHERIRHLRQSLFPFDRIMCWSTHLFVHWYPELTLEISLRYRPDLIFVCTKAPPEEVVSVLCHLVSSSSTNCPAV